MRPVMTPEAVALLEAFSDAAEKQNASLDTMINAAINVLGQAIACGQLSSVKAANAYIDKEVVPALKAGIALNWDTMRAVLEKAKH